MGFICRYCDIIRAIQLNDIVKLGLPNHRICMNMVVCPLTIRLSLPRIGCLVHVNVSSIYTTNGYLTEAGPKSPGHYTSTVH